MIRVIEVDTIARDLRFSLTCGDLQVGYFDLDLSYRGVRIELIDRAALRAVACDPQTEALYDEVDLVARTAQPDRHWDAMWDRYTEA